MAYRGNGEPPPRHNPGDTATPAPSVVSWWRRYVPRGVVWLLLPILSLGILAPFTFTYAAVKRRSPITAIAAVGFVVLGIALWTVPQDGRMFDLVIAVNLIGSACAAIVLRPHVFRVTEVATGTGRPDARWQSPASDWPSPATTKAMTQPPYQSSPQLAQGRAQARAAARSVAGQTPARAVELGIGRPDRQTNYDDGGLVDLNRAPPAALAQLPGLQPHQVDALLHSRAAEGAFLSLDDAMIRAELPPHVESQVAEYAIIY